MTALTMNEIQHHYREKKQKSGWKRIQIWKLDENNEAVKERVKRGAQLVNRCIEEKELLEDMAAYTNTNLQNIPS